AKESGQTGAGGPQQDAEQGGPHQRLGYGLEDTEHEQHEHRPGGEPENAAVESAIARSRSGVVAHGIAVPLDSPEPRGPPRRGARDARRSEDRTRRADGATGDAHGARSDRARPISAGPIGVSVDGAGSRIRRAHAPAVPERRPAPLPLLLPLSG